MKDTTIRESPYPPELPRKPLTTPPRPILFHFLMPCDHEQPD